MELFQGSFKLTGYAHGDQVSKNLLCDLFYNLGKVIWLKKLCQISLSIAFVTVKTHTVHHIHIKPVSTHRNKAYFAKSHWELDGAFDWAHSGLNTKYMLLCHL